MRTVLGISLSVLLAACGGDDDDQGPPGPDAGPDAALDGAAGDDAGTDAGGDDCQPPAHDAPAELCTGEPAPGVRVDEWLVPTPAAPPNPDTGDATPAEQNRVRVMRYRADPPPSDVDAVLVLVPGFLSGASSFDGLARGVVAASAGRAEVWALDRRSNLLEDLTGMEAAEAAEDPDLADAYYFGDAEVDGRRFAGLPSSDDLGHLSEWGLATFMADLRTVLETIPEERRATNLFLGGHSLGGYLVEIASSWDVDGAPLGAGLAGIVPIDGTVSGAGLDRDHYHDGVPGGLMPVPGVDGLRSGEDDRFALLPLLSPTLFVSFEISAMRAFWSPSDVSCDPEIGALHQTLFGIRPWVTNAAVIGLTFDDQYAPISIFAMHIGEATGGPFEHVSIDAFGLDYDAPSDPDVVYSWLERDDDVSCVRSMARASFAGPTNFAEWLFPTRLSLDVRAVADLAVSDAGGDYRWDEEGLRVSRAAEMDAPVLAIAATEGIAPDAAAYEPYRQAIAPTTRDGATRDEDAGFRVLVLDGYGHLDPVTSESAEPAASVAAFLDEHHEGTVQTP